jgi:hypothetical protein
MSEETLEQSCKDCGPTFTAFLEEMAAHNKETKEELGKETKEELAARVVCPTCGKVHEYRPTDNTVRPRAS